MIKLINPKSLIYFFALLITTSFSLNVLASDILFENLHSKAKEAGAEVSWNLKYDQLSTIDKVVIRYRRKIDKNKPWNYTNLIDGNSTKYTISNLAGYEKYDWQVGAIRNGIATTTSIENLDKEKNITWSGKGKFKTERPWGLAKVLILLGALGLFIFGMKLMSEGLQQSAGNGLRKLLGSMTANKYLGVVSGFLITALVQSSSATTVMTVSFVNAGLMTLVESAGIMMGANIGTTITGWLISVFGFKISLSSYALMFIACGAPFMFMSKIKLRGIGNAIIGFALLFMGLGFLKDSVPSLDANSPIVAFFIDYKDVWYGRIMFVLLGTLVTVVVQSSSAAMALTLTMVVKGIIPFEVGAAMILGENIGTTITAELASLIGNVHAKRSARIHSLFNVIGVTWMLFLIPVYLKGIGWFLTTKFGLDPFASGEGATIGLALFHTAFNLTNVFVMIWFVKHLVKLAIKTVPSKGDDDEIFRLEYIGGTLLHTPELSIMEAGKEIHKFGDITFRSAQKVKELINETDVKVQTKLLKKIKKYEDITDRMEVEIADYLSKVARDELSEQLSVRITGMLGSITNLERIGDICYEISKDIERKTENKIWFTQEQRDNLNKLIDLVHEAFEIMMSNLSGIPEEVKMDPVTAKEQEINDLRDKIRRSHLRNVTSKDYNVKAGLIYSNLFASLERMGDHIINISESASGKI